MCIRDSSNLLNRVAFLLALQGYYLLRCVSYEVLVAELLAYAHQAVSYTHLSVLHSRFSNGVQLGKIIGTAVCSEATADFLLYLDFPHSPLTGIVLVRHTWIGEKGK